MNQTQLAQQIRYLLGKRAWGGSGSLLFNDRQVVVSEMPLADLATTMAGKPFAVVRMGGESFDPQWPEIAGAMDVTVEVCTQVPADHSGQASVIGGPRPSFTASGGAGVSELMDEVKAEVKRLETIGGISVLSQISGATKTQRVDRGYWVSKSLTITAKGHAEPFYHPARDIGESGGTISWTNPPDRFDLVSMVLRYASGSTAPSSPTAGTGASLSSDLATSYDASALSGTYSFALFGGYHPRGSSTPVYFSDAITITATL